MLLKPGLGLVSVFRGVQLIQQWGLKVSNLCSVWCTAGSGHAALDVDQPLCHLGLPGLLRLLQLLLGRHHMVSAAPPCWTARECANPLKAHTHLKHPQNVRKIPNSPSASLNLNSNLFHRYFLPWFLWLLVGKINPVAVSPQDQGWGPCG